MRQAAKTKRPTRFRYDRDGNIIGFYVPLQHQSKAEQRRATKAMVSACSAGAYRQSVSPGRTCGYRALKPGSRAGQGLAYARWGFPKGWPKARFHNPAYSVAGLTVKTFKDEEGDWGYAVYSAMGEPLAINTGEPSEKVAAREGKAEARFQAEILSVEGESMRNPKKGLYSKAEIEKARKLGAAAFKAGKTSVPARDAALMGMFKPGPMGSSTPLLEAWADGWHTANLRAPVPNASRHGKALRDAETPYYVKKTGANYELRQKRFRGKRHPHDVVAVARTLTELRDYPLEGAYAAVSNYHFHTGEKRRKAKKNPKSTKRVSSVRSLVARALK